VTPSDRRGSSSRRRPIPDPSRIDFALHEPLESDRCAWAGFAPLMRMTSAFLMSRQWFSLLLVEMWRPTVTVGPCQTGLLLYMHDAQRAHTFARSNPLRSRSGAAAKATPSVRFTTLPFASCARTCCRGRFRFWEILSSMKSSSSFPARAARRAVHLLLDAARARREAASPSRLWGRADPFRRAGCRSPRFFSWRPVFVSTCRMPDVSTATSDCWSSIALDRSDPLLIADRSERRLCPKGATGDAARDELSPRREADVPRAWQRELGREELGLHARQDLPDLKASRDNTFVAQDATALRESHRRGSPSPAAPLSRAKRVTSPRR